MTNPIIKLIIISIFFSCSSRKENTLSFIGQLKTPQTLHISDNNWTIGCEVLDRDYAHYNNYKDYLDTLGCKTARLQGGWAKTENQKGVYDFAWLDEIIHDLTNKRIRPWVQLSYGNPIYPRGGGSSLGGGLPEGEESIVAWDKWVASMVKRYQHKVDYWEIWNEPNFKGEIPPYTYAAFYVRTAQTIRDIQPHAQISALSLSGLGIDYAKAFFHYLDSLNMVHLVDEVTFHPYHKQPELASRRTEELAEVVRSFSSKIRLKQGENGAPSRPYTSGALGKLDWNEHRQAKWFLRRMMSDLGTDMASSVFTIIDFQYPTHEHLIGWNTKGLLKADTSIGSVAAVKPAYHAVQHIASVFDDKLVRIPEFVYSIDSSMADTNQRPLLRADNFFSLFAYEDTTNKKSLIVFWIGGLGADTDADTITIGLNLPNINIDQPVMVDLLSGNIYEMNKKSYKKTKQGLTFTSIKISDSPVLITDRALVVR
jgi:hypothetical protein